MVARHAYESDRAATAGGSNFELYFVVFLSNQRTCPDTLSGFHPHRHHARDPQRSEIDLQLRCSALGLAVLAVIRWML